MDNKFEESIRRIVRDMIKEASDDPDVIVPKKFVTSSPTAGMAADIEEEEPGSLEPSAEELAADSKAGWAAAAKKYSEKPRWADINLKKKKTIEPWQQAGYQAEKPDDSKVRLKPGERDLDMSIADTSNVTGVSPGFIKAMDYKDRVTITDKLKFLTGDPKKVKSVISQAAVEWLDKLEKKKHIDNQVKLHAAIAYGHMADKPVESPEQIRAIVSKPGFDEFTLAWLETHTEPEDYLDYSDFREFLGSHLKNYLEQDPEIQQRMQLWSLPAEERKKKMAELGISED